MAGRILDLVPQSALPESEGSEKAGAISKSGWNDVAIYLTGDFGQLQVSVEQLLEFRVDQRIQVTLMHHSAAENDSTR